uniref:Transcription initiation factor TFIID subunit 7 n=1 Tax=Tanacetum cinerariifolium TaxID=118510 RepID=A0A6L2P000_TANCI|nr:transcription initiation factor TFIID subunit 7 [Tanacetum cinerariifolium]
MSKVLPKGVTLGANMSNFLLKLHLLRKSGSKRMDDWKSLAGLVSKHAAMGISDNGRRGTFTIGKDQFPASLFDFPCIVASHKTYDDSVLIKTADVGQMIMVGNKGDPALEVVEYRHDIIPTISHIHLLNSPHQCSILPFTAQLLHTLLSQLKTFLAERVLLGDFTGCTCHTGQPDLFTLKAELILFLKLKNKKSWVEIHIVVRIKRAGWKSTLLSGATLKGIFKGMEISCARYERKERSILSNNKSDLEKGSSGQKDDNYTIIAEGGDNGVAEKVKAENGSGSKSGANREQLALRNKFIHKSKGEMGS